MTVTHDTPITPDSILPGDIQVERKQPLMPVTAPTVGIRKAGPVARIDRRLSLTDEVREQIILAVQTSASVREAAGFAGIHYDTLCGWLRRGRKYLLHLEAGGEPDWREEPYAQLRQEYERAVPRGVIRARTIVRTIATDEDVPPQTRLKAALAIIAMHEYRERSGADDPDAVDVQASERSIDETSRRLALSLKERAARIIEVTSRELPAGLDDDDFDPYAPWALAIDPP